MNCRAVSSRDGCGKARQAWNGSFDRVMEGSSSAWRGKARQARIGKARSIGEWHRPAGQGRLSEKRGNTTPMRRSRLYAARLSRLLDMARC